MGIVWLFFTGFVLSIPFWGPTGKPPKEKPDPEAIELLDEDKGLYMYEDTKFE